MNVVFRLCLLACLWLLAACGDKAPASTAVKPPPGAEAVKVAKAAGARDKVTVYGRIWELNAGAAAFQMMDTALPYCGEKNPDDHCKTPWDYCCESPDKRRDNSLLVEVRGADGKPLAAALTDLRLLDVVKVTGKITVDEHKNQVLLADAVVRHDRPDVPADLEWPK